MVAFWLGGGFACATLVTPDGEERVRGALWVDGALVNADGAMVVVANSPIPCEPDAVTDDPATEVDEAASATAWWQAQLQSAVTREGAALLAIWLGADAAEGGTFEIDEAGWMNDDPGQGGAVSLNVRESAAKERDGVVFVNKPEDYAVTTDLAGTAIAAVRETDVDMSFTLDDWSGAVTAERCANAPFASTVTRALVDLAAEN